jgi:hypothetical protein
MSKLSFRLTPFKEASSVMWLCNDELVLCVVRSVIIRKHLGYVPLGKISKSGGLLQGVKQYEKYKTGFWR